jgi:diguanylate cyclase (GGDEF)-like protein/PAS domain S-box-containing protein
MLLAPIPANEPERLRALKRYEILDTLPEQAWTDVAVLASQLCETPVGMVSFVDADRVWLKARRGMPLDELPREWSFCGHAILEPEAITVIEDTLEDDRFADNPFVTMPSGVRFYAGAPILTPEGHALGTVCVYSYEPRKLEASQAEGLKALGRQIASALEYRRNSLAEVEVAQRHTDEVTRAHMALRDTTENLQLVLANTPGLIAYWDNQQLNRFSNGLLAEWFGLQHGDLRGAHIRQVIGEEAYQQNLPHIEAALGGEPQRFERSVTTPEGKIRHTQTLFKPHWRDGQVQGFFVLATDITPLKLIQTALQEEKERARVTLSAIGEGVITTDCEGVIDYINPMAEQMSGWTQEQAVGQPIEAVMQLLDETTRRRGDNPLRSALSDGRLAGSPGTTCLLSVDGTERSIEDNASPIRDAEGRVIGGVLVFRDVTQTRLLSRRLSHQAAHDALTGLANRSEFERVASELIASSQSDQRQHALLYLDLDGFKTVNDSCGHLAGDELLRQLTQRLSAALRRSDLLARLGGDEFGVLLPDCPLPVAEKIAKSLVTVVQEHLFRWGPQQLRVGLSIGLTAITEASGLLAEVLSAADTACYRAKKAGTNHVRMFDSGNQEVHNHHHQKDWLGQLNRALAEDAFELFGQRQWPIAEGGDDQQRFEMLLRLRRPDGTLLTPGDFLPAAERYRLMVRIDQWVVRTLLETLALSDASALTHEYSVNLSGSSLNDAEFLQFVVACFEKNRVPFSCVCFEITETAAIANIESAADFISKLRKLGCKFALDDFGSGLSSFACLRKLPVDYLKIDGTFVRGIDQDSVNLAMVEAICRVSQLMHLEVVAECVETAAELACLSSLGIHFGQGYLAHRPELMIKPGKPLLVPASLQL